MGVSLEDNPIGYDTFQNPVYISWPKIKSVRKKNLKKNKKCAVLRRTGPRKNERSKSEYLII